MKAVICEILSKIKVLNVFDGFKDEFIKKFSFKKFKKIISQFEG